MGDRQFTYMHACSGRKVCTGRYCLSSMGGGAAQVQVAKEWEVGSGRVGDGATGMVFVLLHFYGIV
jgi:hypothetical protein